MLLHSLRIDRFGRHSNLEIDALSDGLQVVHGPAGVGKRTLLHFLRATLFGFDAPTREQYLPVGSRGFGGLIELDTLQGHKTISRYDDGSTEGRLTIEHGDGRMIGQRQLKDVVSRLTPDLFDSVFGVDFSARPQVGQLLAVAERAGLQAVPHIDTARITALQNKRDVLQQELQRLGTNLPPTSTLQERRHQLLHEIDALDARGPSLQSSADIQRWEERQRELQHQHAAICCELDAVKHATPHRTVPLNQNSESSDRSVRELDAMIGRWRRVLQDLSHRKQQTQQVVEDRIEPPRVTHTSPRAALRHLEQRILELESEVSAVKRSEGCQCRQLTGSLQNTMHDIRSDLYAVCDALSAWELRTEARTQNSELGQLARCESELQLIIRDLVAQRQALVGQTVASGDSHWCECAAHRASHIETTEERVSTGAATRSAELHAQLADLEMQLSTYQRRLDEARRTAGHDVRERRIRLRQKLHTAEQQLRDAERRQHLLQEVAEIESQIERLRHQATETALVASASRYLQQLSDGHLQRVEIDADNSVTLWDDAERRLSIHRLSRSGQVQVYLALCLAVAATLKHQGAPLPVVLLDAFDEIDQHALQSVAETLVEFARTGHQLVLLTGHVKVPDVFRALHVPVRSLRTFTRAEVSSPARPPSPLPAPAVTKVLAPPAPAATPVVEENVQVTRSRDRWADRQWDAEEFPGELTDRVRFGSDNDEDQEGLTLDLAEAPNGVSLASPIEDAPSVDMANAVRFRKIGVMTVGDLLLVSPLEAETHLHYAGVNAEMVHSWQCQARLVIRVPRLRAYDARILVACGITDPDELQAMSPDQLRDAIRQFAKSRRGKAVLRSGSRYERSRLKRWMRRNRRTAPSTNSSNGRRTSRTSRRRSRRQRTQNSTAATTARNSNPDVLQMNDDSSSKVAWKFYLNADDPIVEAPSIGAKTAERLEAVGIQTVAELLAANAETVAQELGQKRITTKTIQQWQAQTNLASRIPQLRGHDAQILVALDVTAPDELAQSDPDELWARVQPFVNSKQGKRILRNGKEPDLAEVKDWIRWAAAARQLKAA